MNDELVLMQREIPRPRGEQLPVMPFIDMAKVERIRRETAELTERIFGRVA